MKPARKFSAGLSAASGALGALTGAHLVSAQCQPEWSSVGGDTKVSAHALAVHDEDGPGPRPPSLFIGTGHQKLDGLEFDLLARWDGWQASAFEGMEGMNIQRLGRIAESIGMLPAGLFPAGSYYFAGGSSVNNLARWFSPDWHDVGGGLTFDPPHILVIGRDSVVFDEDGDGPLPPRLFVGGRFTLAGGVSVNAIGRWDGVEWSDVGGGLTTGMEPQSWAMVNALAVFDDGRGPALYAGGSFKYAGGKMAYNIARWDGQAWETLSEFGLNSTVKALAVFDEDGDGPKKPALFAGGTFDEVIGDPEKHDGLLRWDGQAWTGVGGWNSGGSVGCMTVWKGPDDERENLYIGGTFAVLPDGTDIKGIARWDGEVWREVDYGVSGFGAGTGIEAMASFDEDGDGPNPGGLYVSGAFYYAGTKGVEARHIARWGCPLAPRCKADLDGNGTLDLFDFLEFVNLFNEEDSGADCDGSGGLDLFDFLCFANEFNEGC